MTTPERPRLRLLKFGGTSLGTPERIAAVRRIVAEAAAARPLHVVVSAFAGVTNALGAAADAAAAGGGDTRGAVEALAARHLEAARALAPAEEATELEGSLRGWLDELADLLHGISLVRECSARTRDAVLAYGELLSSAIVAGALRADDVRARATDARALIVTDDRFGDAAVLSEPTEAAVRQALSEPDIVQVVTGFIGATASGDTTTLGRGGSDYTASLLGAALGAEAVEIWTDVDGVLSADPRLVPQAFSLERLSYVELMELSHFGAKVVHPPSVRPVREKGIPLVIRNTLNPAFPGTWILPDTAAEPPDPPRKTAPVERGGGVAGAPLRVAEDRAPIRGISSINQVVLCDLRGVGLVGVPGIAQRLFGALARDGINVILISQASSEHSICFAVTPSQAERARRQVHAEFELERRVGLVEDLALETELSIIAAVGEAMRETPGIAGRLFSVLGRQGINVRAIAQGSSELNISLVVRREDEARALRAVHDAFFFPRVRAARVFIAGTGRVGSALLDQLAAERERLRWRLGLDVVVGGIARSRGGVVFEDGVELEGWRDRVESAGEPFERVIQAALESQHTPRIFVDCTASREVAARHRELLERGVAVVSANKVAVSDSMELYRRLREAARKGNGLYVETTVGAGLPVLRPIADLVATGDVIARIEGVLSGTLSFLFGRIMEGRPFSDAVREAHGRGFTEPDPREDLSGRDVARKLVILGREAGFEVEPEDVDVQPLLPPDWNDLPLEGFWERLPSLDDDFAERRRAALGAGRRLCYLARVEHLGAGVALEEIGPEHPCSSLSGSDNLIAVTSLRYADTPLVIRGPGAGPDVTAAGVFADILRAAAEAR